MRELEEFDLILPIAANEYLTITENEDLNINALYVVKKSRCTKSRFPFADLRYISINRVS